MIEQNVKQVYLTAKCQISLFDRAKCRASLHDRAKCQISLNDRAKCHDRISPTGCWKYRPNWRGSVSETVEAENNGCPYPLLRVWVSSKPMLKRPWPPQTEMNGTAVHLWQYWSDILGCQMINDRCQMLKYIPGISFCLIFFFLSILF